MRWGAMNLLPLSFSPQGVRKSSISANGRNGYLCRSARYAIDSQRLPHVRGEFEMYSDI
jgi:hypothetical protein